MEEPKKEVGFVGHVFNFDDASRHDMMNVAQYSVLAAIFALLLNKGMDAYIPEVTPTKPASALILEVCLQLVAMFLLVIFAHRVIEFIPTMSGVKYAPYNLTNVILPILIVLFTINTGVGQKVSLIWDKLTGSEPQKQKQKLPPPNTPNLLPSGVSTGNPVQPEPDFNTMFSGPPNPLMNANSPEAFEPMAANSGGMMF